MSVYNMKMTWTVEKADCVDSWSSGTPRDWTESTWNAAVGPKLAEWSKLTWAEIEKLSTGTGHQMHHSMQAWDLSKEAQERLTQLEKSSDVMFRFRLGGKPRLWGFRILSEFEVLWYDPEHEIYPVEVD